MTIIEQQWEMLVSCLCAQGLAHCHTSTEEEETLSFYDEQGNCGIWVYDKIHNTISLR